MRRDGKVKILAYFDDAFEGPVFPFRTRAIAADGPLAITEAPWDSGRFTVTHLPSGSAITGAPDQTLSREEAFALVADLVALPIDWTCSDEEIKQRVDSDPILKDTIDRLRGKSA